MDSFIRSKYESRRWAREGPPPVDPSILESSDNTPRESTPISTSIQEQPISNIPISVTNESPSTSTPTTRQPRPHQLLSAATVGRSSVAQPVQGVAPTIERKPPVSQPPSQPVNDLFTLDFHAPSPSLNTPQPSNQPKTDVKSDILSLFSSSSTTGVSDGSQPATSVVQNNTDLFAAWGQQAQTQATPVTSMVGQTGVGMWGVQSGWSAQPISQAQSSQADIWGSFTSTSSPNSASGPQKVGNTNALFETSGVWGGNVVNTNGAGNGRNDFPDVRLSSAQMQKKDDVFGDLWGDFK